MRHEDPLWHDIEQDLDATTKDVKEAAGQIEELGSIFDMEEDNG